MDWYDELDAERWSIRCVRGFRDGSLKAFSYASADWRTQVPDAPVPPLEEINESPEFRAREISQTELESVWKEATRGGSE